MTTKIKGELEIDHDRGVIYFHIVDKINLEKYQALTLLRISQIDKPIPEFTNGIMLDITARNKESLTLDINDIKELIKDE